jgi:hypothetical protein
MFHNVGLHNLCSQNIYEGDGILSAELDFSQRE